MDAYLVQHYACALSLEEADAWAWHSVTLADHDLYLSSQGTATLNAHSEAGSCVNRKLLALTRAPSTKGYYWLAISEPITKELKTGITDSHPFSTGITLGQPLAGRACLPMSLSTMLVHHEEYGVDTFDFIDMLV